MVKLAESFTKDGMKWTQISRDGCCALYSQAVANSFRYIPVKIMIRPESIINGNIIEKAEMIPSPSHWGTYGWTFMKEQDARKKYEFLKSKYNKS